MCTCNSARARSEACIANLRLLYAVLVIAVLVLPSRGAGQVKSPPPAEPGEGNPDEGDETDYKTPRTEVAGFPIIGGNSDIGLQFGAVSTISRFGDDIRPYRWNLDLLLSAAVKPSQGFTRENIQSNIDMPGLYGGRLRLIPQVAYTNTENLGYFGLGNASSDQVPPDATGKTDRHFESVQRELLLRVQGRIKVGLPFDVVPLVVYRHENPTAYDGSKLETDATSPDSPADIGLRPLSLVSLGGGVVFDTRDNEIFPRRGHYHQLGLKFVTGVPFSSEARYGQDSSVFAWFIPIADDVVFATRALLDLQFGNVPYYDLFTGGPFKTQYMIGGSAGVRGVPIGRFLGRIKLMANQELRAMLFDFRMFGQAFHIGAGAFFDAGRLWLDYSFNNPKDGGFPGIKWGTGVAGYLIWGQAAVFRIDIAYSRWATSFGSSIPIALYVEDNFMF